MGFRGCLASDWLVAHFGVVPIEAWQEMINRLLGFVGLCCTYPDAICCQSLVIAQRLEVCISSHSYLQQAKSVTISQYFEAFKAITNQP